jgi:hypothetical protein
MTTTVYVFFPATKSSKTPRDIESWQMFHWPAAVVKAFIPQAFDTSRPVPIPARLLRQQLPRATEVVEAAVQSEETETAVDQAEALKWQLHDLVLQVEAHEHLTGSETLIRTQSY